MSEHSEIVSQSFSIDEALQMLGCAVIQMNRNGTKAQELQEKCESLEHTVRNQSEIIDKLSSNLGNSNRLCEEAEKSLNDAVAELNHLKGQNSRAYGERIEDLNREIARLNKCIEVNDGSYRARIEELNRQLCDKSVEFEELRKKAIDTYYQNAKRDRFENIREKENEELSRVNVENEMLTNRCIELSRALEQRRLKDMEEAHRRGDVQVML